MEPGVSRPAVIGLLALAGLGIAHWRAAAGPRPTPGHEGARVTARPAGAGEESESLVMAKAPPSFGRYRALLDRNPFTPKVLPKPPVVTVKPAPVLPPAGPPKVEPPKDPAKEGAKDPTKAAAPPPGPPDPLKDWTYTGTVVIGPEVYAVAQNKSRVEYLKEGDSFQGGTVVRVAQGALLIGFGGENRSLQKSTAFNATPLNAPAGGGGAPAGGPGAPAGPGAPGARPGGAPAPGAPPAGRAAGESKPAGPATPAPAPASAPAPAPAAAPVMIKEVPQ